MKDERREKLDNRLTPIDLFKLTPRTNCGECSFGVCLAFATQVIVGRGSLDSCPHLDAGKIEEFRKRLEAQHRDGIGIRREGFEKALLFLREEMGKCNLRELAPSLGADFEERDGVPSLRMAYLGEPIVVTRDDVSFVSGKPVGPWEKIFLFNYVIGGAVEPAGAWVGMETLPNSVSKIKSLRDHCEARLAKAFAGKTDQLPAVVSGLGVPIETADRDVDFTAEFQVLPKLAIRILWWDEDPAEGFSARVKFLFDGRVLMVLDLESLLFACEQLTDRLIDRAAAGPSNHIHDARCPCHG